ncbi:hypothetical protein ACFL1X_13925, partial [Candidatus Hydrogenedentota bacterium]
MSFVPMLHPCLFAAYRVLALYAHNSRIVPIRAVILPGILIVGGVLAFWAILRLFTKDGHKSGLIVTLLLFMFFFFDPVS